MKRPREVITKEEFHKVIQAIFPESSIVWKDVPQLEEPPDWFLTIDNERYAVEATTIDELIQLNKNELVSIFGITNSLTSFIKEIEQLAIDLGILSGTYFISIFPIPDFIQKKKLIKKVLLDYIRETKQLASASTHIIADIKGHKILITKGNFNKDCVIGGILTSVRLDGEVQKRLLQSVAHSLSMKSNKLHHIAEPKILLLFDRYPYSDMVDWTSVIHLCPEREYFCCICRIHPPDKTAILWANSPIWKAIGTG